MTSTIRDTRPLGVIRHDEHMLDRAAMLAIRGFIKLSAAPPMTPEGRPGYDELIARTSAPEGVSWTEGEVGGVQGWWCHPADAVPGRAILYLHGGGYVIGSAAAYRGLASQIGARARASTFIADYRLAPEHPFPAAFEDAGRALAGLRSAGYSAVAVVGDSAGGGLALASLAAGGAGQAVAAALFSPYIDLSHSGESMTSRADLDPILSPATLQQAADQYLNGANPRDPRINAMAGDLSSLPSIRIDVGEDEILLDDALRFDTAARAADIACEVHVWQGMVHVFPTNIAILQAASEALNGVGAFLEAAFDRARLA